MVVKMAFGLFKKNNNVQMGLDINPDGIIAVILEKRNKNIALKNYDFEGFDEETIQKGVIINSECFIKTLKAIVSRQSLNIKDVNIALSTNIAFIKTISLPDLPMEELNIIAPQEASKHIPYPIETVNIDFQILGKSKIHPNGDYKRQEGQIEKVDVILAALTKEISKNYTEVIEEANLNLRAIDISPFALVKTLANAEYIDNTDAISLCVLIDYENTDINIIHKGMPVYSHTVNIGKKNILDCIASALEITSDKVLKLLPEIFLIIPGMESNPDPQLNKAFSSLKTVFNSIGGEIQKTIEFYTSQSGEEKPIKNIVIGGCGVCINNIDKYLTNRLKIETILCDPLKNIRHDLTIINPSSIGVSVGLALKGFENKTKNKNADDFQTISINLVNKGNKSSKKIRKSLRKEDIEPKIKLISVILVISSCIIFSLSGATWLVAHHYTKKFTRELGNLKLKNEQLNLELDKTSFDYKKLEQDRKILELKLLAYNQIKSNWISWHKILNDIPKIVPKDIKITEISKINEVSMASSSNTDTVPFVTIKGKIPEKVKGDPVQLISYFALNINEHPSLKLSLSDASIKTVDHKDKDHLYEFSIEAQVESLVNKSLQGE